MPTYPILSPLPDAPCARIGVLSTFPPKLCGLATFAAALVNELVRGGARVDMVRIDDGGGQSDQKWAQRAELVNGVPATIRSTANVLSQCDVAIIQHEYGIYGGPDGDEVLQVMAALDVPAIVILHTVPLQPTAHQRVVLETVCDMAARVVVMTDTAKTRLVGLYEVDSTRVVIIAHGAASPTRPSWNAVDDVDHDQRTRLLTWGLLGPGKGVEHVIEAMGMIGDLGQRVTYTVAGVTHPKVLARTGDVYRQSLIELAWRTGVAGSVVFDDTYRDVSALTRFVAAASVVVLPYDSRDQVTSGVLVDAIAAGRPVIATGFPHARELLSSGAGIIVPHGDPSALADAIRSVVNEPQRLDAMVAEARRLAPALGWRAIAGQYRELCGSLVGVGESVTI
jgi:polysaccharide biosynthesis protein PslF